jgi:hypothetical protein
VAIDRSSKWWRGSDAADVHEYLKLYKAEGYPLHETRLCKCVCGSIEFGLKADRNGGCAERTCAACEAKHLICDSAEYWEDAEPQNWQCTECGWQICNLGVGFSLYDEEGGAARDVRWISVGERCANCGILGCYVDWKVGYGPSHHLLDQG